jgi:hypothetical protein
LTHKDGGMQLEMFEHTYDILDKGVSRRVLSRLVAHAVPALLQGKDVMRIGKLTRHAPPRVGTSG